MFKIATVAAFVACCATPGLSAVVDFTNSTNGANGSYEDPTFSIGAGITMTVSAGVYLFDTIVNPDVDGFGNLVVSKRDAGLGVALGFLPGLGPDVNGPGDLLTFSFSAPVYLQSISFGNVDGDDNFDLFVDGGIFASEVNVAGENPAVFANIPLTSFSVGADAIGANADDFTIASVQVQPVPVPAGLAFGASGLAVLAGLSRRRRRAA